MIDTGLTSSRFYVAAWEHPQTHDEERIRAVRNECETKLKELAKTTSPALQAHIARSIAELDDIMGLPWVLTHDDLSGMNLLVNATTGRLQGVVDWADAALWPFGMSLWGVESILGYDAPTGWIWLDDEAQSCRSLFSKTLQNAMELPADTLGLIEKSRVLGLLLRYGFVWQDGAPAPSEDTRMLEAFLERKSAVPSVTKSS